MAKRVELPQTPRGDAEEQLRTLYSYLYQMAETLNNNLAEIGGAELTDTERRQLTEIIGDGTLPEGQLNEAETLKSLIVKTANFVQSTLKEYRLNLLGEYVADGKFGKYVRRTGLDVDVTPTGIQQNFTFQEIIQGLKTYEINAKNYIKTGLLRTVSSIPVYGVAIGKDVVTFAEDGTETYNDGNKVAELTADELSFWQGGYKIASYTGSKISFLYSGSEVMYIQNGKIYCAGDFEIQAGKTFKIVSGGSMNVDANNIKIDSSNGFLTAIKNDDLLGENFNLSIGKNWYLNSENYVITLESGLDDSIINGVAKRTYPYATSIEDAVSVPGYKKEFAMRCGTMYRSIQNTAQLAQIMEMYALSKRWNGSSYVFDANENVYLMTYGAILNYIESSNAKIVTGNITTVNYTNLVQNSSREIKHDIRDMESCGEKLDRLRPVTFVYDDDPAEKRRAGLIYEETAEVLPEICTGDESAKAISYVEMIPMLLKEIQELRARVKALEEREGGN